MNFESVWWVTADFLRRDSILLALFGKRTYKPNSVACGHSSRRRVAADTHQRPTRRFRQLLEPPQRIGPIRSAAWLFAAASLPIWSCSVWGLPCPRHYCRGGALLPHLFTLTPLPGRYVFCGTFRPSGLNLTSRTLSGTLLCGVRTFLSSHPKTRERPSGPAAYRSIIRCRHSSARLWVRRRTLIAFSPIANTG